MKFFMDFLSKVVTTSASRFAFCPRAEMPRISSQGKPFAAALGRGLGLRVVSRRPTGARTVVTRVS
jgi:hypothetical protein